jgi:hypothetical protein
VRTGAFGWRFFLDPLQPGRSRRWLNPDAKVTVRERRIVEESPSPGCILIRMAGNAKELSRSCP